MSKTNHFTDSSLYHTYVDLCGHITSGYIPSIPEITIEKEIELAYLKDLHMVNNDYKLYPQLEFSSRKNFRQDIVNKYMSMKERKGNRRVNMPLPIVANIGRKHYQILDGFLRLSADLLLLKDKVKVRVCKCRNTTEAHKIFIGLHIQSNPEIKETMPEFYDTRGLSRSVNDFAHMLRLFIKRLSREDPDFITNFVQANSDNINSKNGILNACMLGYHLFGPYIKDGMVPGKNQTALKNRVCNIVTGKNIGKKIKRKRARKKDKNGRLIVLKMDDESDTPEILRSASKTGKKSRKLAIQYNKKEMDIVKMRGSIDYACRELEKLIISAKEGQSEAFYYLENKIRVLNNLMKM